jgi:hypothetical protein
MPFDQPRPTISQPTPLISWITAWTITRAFSLLSISAISDGSRADPVERQRPKRAMFEYRCRNRRWRRGHHRREAGDFFRTGALTSIAALVNSSSIIDRGTPASGADCRSFWKKSDGRPGVG